MKKRRVSRVGEKIASSVTNFLLHPTGGCRRWTNGSVGGVGGAGEHPGSGIVEQARERAVEGSHCL